MLPTDFASAMHAKRDPRWHHAQAVPNFFWIAGTGAVTGCRIVFMHALIMKRDKGLMSALRGIQVDYVGTARKGTINRGCIYANNDHQMNIMAFLLPEQF